MIADRQASGLPWRLLRYVAILGAVLCAPAISAPARAGAVAESPTQFALIIGVSEVPGLPRLRPLQGVANDVEAMRRLAGRLGVRHENLRVLSDTGSAIVPTYSAIAAALQWIEEQTSAGNQVMIYFAGHGGQQPENALENPVVRERDGLDEIYFARDAGPWDEAKSSAANVLTDNALRRWLEHLHQKNVAVWLIVDMCHAGTFSRGGPQTAQAAAYDVVALRGASLADIGIDPSSPRWRQLAIGGREALSVFSNRLSKRDSAEYREGTLSNVVAFYATDEGAQTPEVRSRNAEGKVHGLFTLFLTEEANRLLDLQAVVAVANYRLLMQRILARYRNDMPAAATPTFEGVDAGTWFGTARVGK